MHLQKTAGSTLNAIIDRNYPHNRMYAIIKGNDKLVSEFANQPEAMRAKLQMLRGVTYYGIHEHIPRESRYFTMIRNPVERIISHYLFRQRKGHTVTLEQFLEERPEQFNVQVVTLLGNTSRAETLRQPLDSTSVERAKEHIRTHFSLVGLTERFDESLVMMGKRFGWKKLYYAKKLVTPNAQRKQISDQQRAWLTQHTTYDMELYEWAKAEFDAMIKSQPPSFKDDLARLAQESARFSRIYNATAAIRQSKLYHRFRKTFWPAWEPWTPEDDD